MSEKPPSAEQPQKPPEIKLYSEEDLEFYKKNKEAIEKDYENINSAQAEYELVLDDIDKILQTSKDPAAAKKSVLEHWKPIAQKAALREGKARGELQKKYGAEKERAIGFIRGFQEDIAREQSERIALSEEERRAIKERRDRLWKIENEFVFTDDFYTKETE